MKSIVKLSLAVAILVFAFGCSKSFLNTPPIDTPTSDNFYRTDAEIQAGTAPLYNIVWFDYNDKAFMAFGTGKGGDLLSNDRTAYIQFSVSATDVFALLPGYKSFYKIVAQSNQTIQNILNAKNSSATQKMMNTGVAECRFMRGMAYFYLVSNWGAVPIIYNNLDQMSNDLYRNNIEDVWKFIILDFTYAANNLPATPYQQGRVTKYSAEGMLAKAYLTRAGYGQSGTRLQSDLDSAKYYAADVCTNSGNSLLPNYHDLFLSANNNSSNNNVENLFALQWMPYSGAPYPWGINNSFQAYVAFSTDITQTGDGWGSAQGASADLLKYYLANPLDSIRRKETFMFPGDYYPEIEQKTGGLNISLDTANPAHIKKYVIGSPADNGGKGMNMAAYINTYMLRLAEVYLIYADAILGNSASTSDATALQYFNAVRTRAGMPTESSITFKDIFQEKRIETAMEGNAWYDILRWYYFDPKAARDYVAGQDKGSYKLYPIIGSNPRKWNAIFTSAYWPVTDQTVYLPLPESELNIATNLGKPPVPFDFSKLPNY
ncbi:MAG: RagB/SusD family nutrient uptake outer membrane protein [Chitinophagaceae bacterium]|jgi:hypothetical protein|nr:RagB/SusD family nutrient uptake outer membrane protein [Chitinophagaceae bacterium]